MTSALIETKTAGQPAEPYLKIRPPRGWAPLNLRDIWQFRDLLAALAGRDVKLRYKQTALGVLWVILQPLMGAGVFSFVFGRIAQLPSDGLSYFVFSYAGLLGWNLFNGILSKTSTCLIGNSQLVSKTYFPRLVLPLSAVPSALIDFGVALGMMAALLLIYHVQLRIGVLLLPIWIVMLLMVSVGVGLISAALMVSYRDVAYILPVLTQLLFWGSPVAYKLTYALEKIPQQYHTLYLLNPLAIPLEGFRASLLGTPLPALLPTLYAAGASLAVFLIGAYSFKKMERKFADVI